MARGHIGGVMTQAHPDPAPQGGEIKRWERFRAQAGVLVARELRALQHELQAGIDARMRRIGRDGGYQDLRAMARRHHDLR